ncbi:MAG: DUF882 domain-containing protein [Caulobacteraceae bacterium]
MGALQSVESGPCLVFTPVVIVLKFGMAAAAFAAPGAAWATALPSTAPRQLTFDNLHTGEKLQAVYFDRGAYVPDALQAVNHVLRDFRTGDVHEIHPQLLDLLHVLQGKVGTSQAFEVISGYRSPKTNAMLHEASSGVATHSLHMDGMAIDIRLGDVDLAHLHDAALAMQAGGVGYYPASNFVHVGRGRGAPLGRLSAYLSSTFRVGSPTKIAQPAG